MSRINFLFWQGGYYRGVAQLGLERLLWEQEAAGSSPVTPTIWGCSLSNPLGFESKQASGNGAGGIRTPVTQKGETVFKTVALSRSATAPEQICPDNVLSVTTTEYFTTKRMFYKH